MCTVIALLRAPTGEERVLIKIEFNRATIMFELLRASIKLVRTNCVAHIFNQGAQLIFEFLLNWPSVFVPSVHMTTARVH